jgi:hypothetical protein
LIKQILFGVKMLSLGMTVITALLLLSLPVSQQERDMLSLTIPRIIVDHSSGFSPSRLLSHSADHTNVRKLEQKEIQNYHIWSAQEIKEVLDLWIAKYSNFVKVTTSQEAYGLPPVGGSDDCPFDDAAIGCRMYILTIQDFTSHPVSSSSSSQLPEVFWSGSVHGDERVGPSAVMEAASLLLEAASCEALPKWNRSIRLRQNSIEEARSCRTALRDKGIDDIHRQWLARLVSTRRIVIVPTANALGYFRDTRTENGIDPNRDFPYDVADPTLCMRSIAGRTINEIYREHMFQLALTFHGGMEVLAYEWGAPSHLGFLSPDDEAQNQVAAAYSRFGGGWSTSKPYAYGTMNDMVYYVRGGMEDWAYAGSWDKELVLPCEPKEFGGYPKEKTVYKNSTLRAFNILVEASTQKHPRENELGTSLDVLSRNTGGNGHISRNIRLSLLAADLVEPYVSIVVVNNLTLSDDIVPSTYRGGRSCQTTKAVRVPQNSRRAVIAWTVGGAMHVNYTEVFFARWDDIPEDQLDCLNQPKSMKGFIRGKMVGPKNGTGAFSGAGAHPIAAHATQARTPRGQVPTMGPLFRATLNIPNDWDKLDQIVVVAAARVDAVWAKQPSKISPNRPPQSHIVNARNNPNWRHESAGNRIQGRLKWYSIPLTIIFEDDEDSISMAMGSQQIPTMEQQFQQIPTVEYDRFGESHTSGNVVPMASQHGRQFMLLGLSWVWFAIVLAIGLFSWLNKFNGWLKRDWRSLPSPSPGLLPGGLDDRGYSDIPNAVEEGVN